jgi:hypothetical protein
MPANAKTSKRNNPSPDPYVATLLGRVSEGKHVMNVPKGKKIFSQGDRADAIYFIQSGRVLSHPQERKPSWQCWVLMIFLVKELWSDNLSG